MLFLFKQPLTFLLVLHLFLGHVVHPSTANLFNWFNPACPSCRTFGTLLYYNDTVTKKCVETCIILGYFYQSPTLKCGKCPPTPPPPPPPPPPDTSYSITLDFDTSLDSKYRPVFQQSKTKWEGIVTGDLQNVNITAANVALTKCNVKAGQIIDDLLVCVKAANIDNEGGFFAQYTVDLVRLDGANKDLPAVSQMTIDSSDIATLFDENRLYTWMTYYMGLAMGFGDRWAAKGLAAPVKPCAYSYGAAASREFRTLSGCTIAVPLEQSGSSGDCKIWDGGCIDAEMMSSSLTVPPSGIWPISRISVAAMEDLGYKVNYAKADPFTILNAKANCCPTRRLGEDTDGTDTTSVEAEELSEAEYAKAIAYGKKVLAEAAAVQKQVGTALTGDVKYVGGEVVGLIWEEKGKYFKLIVTNTD